MDLIKDFIHGSRRIRSKYFGPVGKLLSKFGVKATHLTILAFLFGLAAFYFLFLNHFYFILMGLLHWFFDGLDGVVARASKPTKFGAHFDNISDRTIVILILIKTYLYFNDYFILIVLGLYVLQHLIYALSDLKSKVVYCRASILVLYFFGFYTLGFFAVGIFSLYGLAQQFNSFLKKRFTT